MRIVLVALLLSVSAPSAFASQIPQRQWVMESLRHFALKWYMVSPNTRMEENLPVDLDSISKMDMLTSRVLNYVNEQYNCPAVVNKTPAERAILRNAQRDQAPWSVVVDVIFNRMVQYCRIPR